ncbi:HpcH/HpaI aldolase/citrate lyase family protein [Nocardia salmonicida]|uniref:HpcH/HpaI aldolase/citrate lyase family protein n=1 Tax=Nocardia salmonicida TaxID=53431 RepID=UPI0033CC40DD
MRALPAPTRRRAVLVVPGFDERKITKALATGADEVVIDLEDAVAVDSKAAARTLVVRILDDIDRDPARSIAVRVNALGTEWAADDLAALASVSELDSVVLPKAEAAADLVRAHELLGGHRATLQALIETPRGVQDIDEICRTTAPLAAVVIGYADLGAALGRGADLPPQRWAAIQDRVLVAARACGVAAIDGPHLGIADNADFRNRVRWAREAGFDGKWVLHPGQIGATTTEFTPDPAAVETARRVLAALDEAAARGLGVARLGDQMLDEAVAVAARRILARTEGN